MTTADDLDSVWADARAALADAFHTDVYEVWRGVDVSNGRGGNTKDMSLVESGSCVLRVEPMRSGEHVAADLALTTTLYTAELPIDSVLVTTDDLKINGRTFDPLDVKRGGDWGLFAEVRMLERMP